MKRAITKLHPYLDYAIGALLLLPWVCGFYAANSETWILGAIGVAIIVYSLLTDYPGGLLKFIPMRLHVILDVLTGLVLVAMPFLLPVYPYYFYWPMMIGLLVIVLAIFTYGKKLSIDKKDTNITQPL